MIIVLSLVAWFIAGAIVVESCRIWGGAWYVNVEFSTMLLWPLVLIHCLFGGHK